MSSKKNSKMTSTKKKHLTRELESSAGGAIAGAAVGAFAGPPGAIAGAVLGAVAGAVVEYGIDNDAASRAEEDRTLDAAIGVSGGEMGAPNLKHPAARVGAYSSASMGGGSSDVEQPAEGPMQAPK